MALALGMLSNGVMAKTLNVVTSFSILGDITQEVGGDHVNVTTLVGPDGDPHTFEPSPKDSAALSKADVVVVNGLGLEGWIDRLVKASGFKGQLVVASAGVKNTHPGRRGQNRDRSACMEQRGEWRTVCAKYSERAGKRRSARQSRAGSVRKKVYRAA